MGRLEDVEYIVVDWGSEVPLHKELELNDCAKEIVRFIIVPPVIANNHGVNGKFSGSLAINVGIRRGRGNYIAETNGDVLYDTEILSGLLTDACDTDFASVPDPEKVLFLIRVKNIPEDVTRESPDLPFIDHYIRENRDGFRVQPLLPFFGGGAGALMMHRSLWDESRGFEEDWYGWGWSDADLKLRICLKYRAEAYGTKDGLYAYHLDHPSSAAPHENRFNPFIVNGVHWGLAGHRLAEFPPADPIEVPPAPEAWPGPGNMNPWLRHFLNLLKFLLASRDPDSFRSAYHALNVMLLGLQEKNPVRKLYVWLKRLKDSRRAA